MNLPHWRRASRFCWRGEPCSIAKEEYPDLSVDQYLDRSSELAREAARWVAAGANTVEKVQNLSQFLFEHKRFAGNRTSYGDPRNSFLNDVIERKFGIPISASRSFISRSGARRA